MKQDKTQRDLLTSGLPASRTSAARGLSQSGCAVHALAATQQKSRAARRVNNSAAQEVYQVLVCAVLSLLATHVYTRKTKRSQVRPQRMQQAPGQPYMYKTLACQPIVSQAFSAVVPGLFALRPEGVTRRSVRTHTAVQLVRRLKRR